MMLLEENSFKDHILTETYDAIVLTVAHNEFIQLDLERLKKRNTVVYDVKGILESKAHAKL